MGSAGGETSDFATGATMYGEMDIRFCLEKAEADIKELG